MSLHIFLQEHLSIECIFIRNRNSLKLYVLTHTHTHQSTLNTKTKCPHLIDIFGGARSKTIKKNKFFIMDNIRYFVCSILELDISLCELLLPTFIPWLLVLAYPIHLNNLGKYKKCVFVWPNIIETCNSYSLQLLQNFPAFSFNSLGMFNNERVYFVHVCFRWLQYHQRHSKCISVNSGIVYAKQFATFIVVVFRHPIYSRSLIPYSCDIIRMHSYNSIRFTMLWPNPNVHYKLILFHDKIFPMHKNNRVGRNTQSTVFFFSVSRKKATTIYYSHAYRLQDHNYIHNQNHCRKYKRSTLAGTLTKHMYNLFLNPSVYCLLFSVTLFKSCAYSIPNGFYSRRRIPVNLLSTVLITRNQRLKTCDFICKTP